MYLYYIIYSNSIKYKFNEECCTYFYNAQLMNTINYNIDNHV